MASMKYKLDASRRAPEIEVDPPELFSNQLYPMWCVTIEEVLNMSSVERHEKLRDQGKLVQHQLDSPEVVIFVTHQWLSIAHPDPRGEQLAVLQDAFRRLLIGAEVRSNWSHSAQQMADTVERDWPTILRHARVWYDYFSIPQEKQHVSARRSAINSITAYVEQSAYTFVLAPNLHHFDYRDDNGEPQLCDLYSWAARGWCRTEMLVSILKSKSKPLVFVRSAQYIYFGNYHFVGSAWEGEFSCCRLKHEHRTPHGELVTRPCDKPLLFSVTKTLIERRCQSEQRKGNLRAARVLLVMRAVWLNSLFRDKASTETHNPDVEAFCREYLFPHAWFNDGGWTPLLLACLVGNVPVVRQLLDMGVDVDAPLTETCLELGVGKGTTILGHIAMLATTEDHCACLDLLIAFKADPRPPGRYDALTFASLNSSAAKMGAKWVLTRFPTWDVNSPSADAFGVNTPVTPAMMWSIHCNDLNYLSILIELNADVTTVAPAMGNDVFCNLCGNAPTSSARIVAYVASVVTQQYACRTPGGQFNINRRMALSPCWLPFLLKVLLWLDIGPSSLHRQFLLQHGATALLLAASKGKLQICRWLLENAADPSMPNYFGDTPLSISKKRGFQDVCDLLRSFEPRSACDV